MCILNARLRHDRNAAREKLHFPGHQGAKEKLDKAVL